MFTNENVFDLVICFTGVLLVFRRVAVMERYHTARVFFLTVVLCCLTIFLFLGFCLPKVPFDDCINFDERPSQNQF